MMHDAWRELERIFNAAREVPAAGRTEFVARESRGDRALQDEALALLRADERSGEFMAQPALERLAKVWTLERSSLAPGERVGAYTIVELLGSGGAGEVWRARDERLHRDVAIKVLLPHWSTDAERLRRFAEEARAAGALNHSNILTVYDVGEHAGAPFLVAECLEGESLRSRLDARRIGMNDAIGIGLGVASALAAAHERGIVHRDLKPENLFVLRDGAVKVLDFGLAKLAPSATSAQHDWTATRTIIGTAAYMAPEQLKREPVDARTDLFALGVVLYETLAGKHPFRGASTFETLHAILTREPEDLAAVDEQIPPEISRIVMRLVQKPPSARFQSARDLAWALEIASRGNAPSTRRPPPRRAHFFAWIATAVLASGVLAAGLWSVETARTPQPARTVQFTWTLPAGVTLDSAPMVAPDGGRIAFVGRDAAGSRLYVRELDSLEAQYVPGTEGARQPFWSPDGAALGFFTGGRLVTLAWPSGAPIPIAEAPEPRGGAWSAAGTIVFAPDVISFGLSRTDTAGSRLEPATVLDSAHGDTSHRWPAFLPDGVHFVYFVRSTNDERRGAYLARVDRPAAAAGAPLFRSESNAVFVPLDGGAGALLYVDGGRVELRRFDVASLSVGAEARALGLSAASTTLYHPALFSASSEVLALARSTVPGGNRLAAVARSGETLRSWDEAETQNWPRISPDGRKLARQRVDPLRNNPDIWVDDLERGTRVRVTTAADPDIQPVWSPDSQQLAYVTGALPGRAGDRRTLSIAAADGTGVVRAFPCPGNYCEPTDWSTDGGTMIVNVIEAGRADVYAVALDEAATARPLLAEAAAERDARLSPNGRWLAYVAEESGHAEISVRSVAGAPRRFVVSADGGAQPVWRRDGGELFFVDPEGRLAAVPVEWNADGEPALGLPTRLPVPAIGLGHWGTQYDVSPDGSQIYLLRRNDDPAPSEIHVVVGWRELLDSAAGS